MDGELLVGGWLVCVKSGGVGWEWWGEWGERQYNFLSLDCSMTNLGAIRGRQGSGWAQSGSP